MSNIESAIYVDFDNIFTSLDRCYSISAAEDFVSHIPKWLEFISTCGLKSIKRIFRKKVVYLNPCAFARHRNIFVRSGFRAIDCPPLTSYEKTATDMYMAVDIINDTFKQNYQDYVILSGDADFSPVLFHINESCRNSILLGIGHVSSVYESIASVRINEQEFVSSFTNISSNDNLKSGITNTPKPGTPLVRVIKRGGEENKNKDQSICPKQQDSKDDKRKLTLNSLSDLPNIFKVKEEENVSTISIVQNEKVYDRKEVLSCLGLPSLEESVVICLFKHALDYTNNLKSKHNYKRSVYNKIQKQFTHINKNEIKEYLKYLPYDSLVLEMSASKVFLQLLYNNNIEALKAKNISQEDLNKILNL